MEGVLEAALFLCVWKVSCNSLLFLPAVTHAVSAVSLCCMCLLLFTDLAVTLFLFFLWISESWLIPFHVSSDVIALRFLIFLSQVYGVVLLLTPLLIAVELLVRLLRSQENTEDTNTQLDKKDEITLLRTTSFLSCLLVWIVSGIYSRNSWKLGQISTESCLDRTSCLITCLPGFFMMPPPGMEELSWIVPALVLLLSLTGGLGLLKAKSAHRFTHLPKNTFTQRAGRKDHVALSLTPIQQPMNLYVSPSSGTQSKKTPDSCAVYRAGFVYNEERWFCLQNVTLCSYQTGLADSFVQQQKLSTSRAPFLQSKTKLLLEMRSPEDHEVEHCDYKETEPVVNETQSERENPCLGGEMFRGLVCAVLVYAFPTVVSGNVLLILNLETLVVHTLKLLSR